MGRGGWGRAQGKAAPAPRTGLQEAVKWDRIGAAGPAEASLRESRTPAFRTRPSSGVSGTGSMPVHFLQEAAGIGRRSPRRRFPGWDPPDLRSPSWSEQWGVGPRVGSLRRLVRGLTCVSVLSAPGCCPSPCVIPSPSRGHCHRQPLFWLRNPASQRRFLGEDGPQGSTWQRRPRKGAPRRLGHPQAQPAAAAADGRDTPVRVLVTLGLWREPGAGGLLAGSQAVTSQFAYRHRDWVCKVTTAAPRLPCSQDTFHLPAV